MAQHVTPSGLDWEEQLGRCKESHCVTRLSDYGGGQLVSRLLKGWGESEGLAVIAGGSQQSGGRCDRC